MIREYKLYRNILLSSAIFFSFFTKEHHATKTTWTLDVSQYSCAQLAAAAADSLKVLKNQFDFLLSLWLKINICNPRSSIDLFYKKFAYNYMIASKIKG